MINLRGGKRLFWLNEIQLKPKPKYIKHVIISLILSVPLVAFASPVNIAEAPVSPQIASGSTIEQKIEQYSLQYGVSYNLMNTIVKNESGYNPSIQSNYPDPTGPNGREDSWGLAQIHLPAHKDITREQAQDPDFALNFLAKNLKEGHCSMWTTCPK